VTSSAHPSHHPGPGSAGQDVPPALRARRPPGPATSGTTVTALSRVAGNRQPVPLATVQGTLALDLYPGPLPGAPGTPDLRVVPDARPSDRQDHGDLQAWTARFAQATVEVLGGDRPLPQLVRWTSARVYQDLERRVRILAQTGPAPLRQRTVRPQVRSVHVFRPGPHSAEVSVHVRHGHRSRAIAARLEERDGSWRCVALQLG